MELTHQCPNCGRLHEQPTTPEPDRCCDSCERTIADVSYIHPSRVWGVMILPKDGAYHLHVGNLVLVLNKYQFEQLRDAVTVADRGY